MPRNKRSRSGSNVNTDGSQKIAKKPKLTGKGKKNNTADDLSEPSQKKSITDDDKFSIIQQMRLHPSIWNMELESYRRPDVQQGDWEKISSATMIPVDQFKKAWKSLRVAFKNRKGKKKVEPSGSGQAEPTFEDEDQPEEREEVEDALSTWKFCSAMDFYANRKPIVTTKSSMPANTQSDAETFEDSDNHEDGTNESNNRTSVLTTPVAESAPSSQGIRRSNYSYGQPPKPHHHVDKLAGSLDRLIMLREREAHEFAADQKTELKFQVMYAYIDSLLKQLPHTVAEDLLDDLIVKLQEAKKRVRDIGVSGESYQEIESVVDYSQY